MDTPNVNEIHEKVVGDIVDEIHKTFTKVIDHAIEKYGWSGFSAAAIAAAAIDQYFEQTLKINEKNNNLPHDIDFWTLTRTMYYNSFSGNDIVAIAINGALADRVNAENQSKENENGA